MSQVTNYTTPGTPLTMAALKVFLDNCYAASASANRGATAPSNPFEGMHWWDTSGDPTEILKRYTATGGWVSLLSVNITTGAVALAALTGVQTIPTIALTGGQIAFPADAVPSADANTLDDYEEGTWTPDVLFTAGKVDITYSLQAGKYTKIGNMVYASCRIILASKGSSNGNANIAALPFNINGHVAACLSNHGGITFANQLSATGLGGTVAIYLYECTEAGVATTITDGNFTDAASIELRISISYNI